MMPEEINPDRFQRIMELNGELSDLMTKTAHVIVEGVCEAYEDRDLFQIAMVQLETTMRFTNSLQSIIIDALNHGLEEMGEMKTMSDEETKASPEFKTFIKKWKVEREGKRIEID